MKYLFIFKNIQQFRSVFNGKSAADVRQMVVSRGWHHFNMQAIAYISTVLLFYSLEMLDFVTFAGVGFFAFTAAIYANTQRNIKFTELL